MKNPNGNLDRALAKCHRFSDTRQWCGYFTPSEIKALLTAGVRPAHNDDYILRVIDEEIAQGISQTRWFYFYPVKVKMRTTDHGRKHDRKNIQ